MKKIILYEETRPDIKISMELYFNEQGQLIFDGYDIGKTVEEWHGDSDYEYSYTIEETEVAKIYPILEVEHGNQASLLLEIKNRFGGNKAYSQFGDFLRKHKIDFTSFSWS